MKSFDEQLREVGKQLWGEPERVWIVFDECNLQLAALSILGRRIDYQATCERILAGHRVACSPPRIITDATDRVEAFVHAMERRGFEVVTVSSQRANGKLKNRTDSYVHKALYEAGDSEADVVALVSGDGDFEPALRYLKEVKGKTVEVFALRDTLAVSLWAAADRAEYLDGDEGTEGIPEGGDQWCS